MNTPASHLGPAELAQAVRDLADAHGARVSVIEGAALQDGFPALAAVGAASPRAPRVAMLEWGAPDAPLVALCGKGVCFDTGGLDLKPAGPMLRMKKDMGGAALVLGVAEMVMRLRLPVRLLVLVGAVENAVAGNAFRPRRRAAHARRADGGGRQHGRRGPAGAVRPAGLCGVSGSPP